jgi:hypothetical protein
MTVREVLREESRELSGMVAVAAVASFIIPAMVWWIGFPRLAVCVFVVFVATFMGIDFYRRYVALCCPRCGKSLGPILFGANWYTRLDQLDRCPPCNLDLDRELETIQTI